VDGDLFKPARICDDKGEPPVDEWLKTWFQQMLDEPPPNHLIDLLDRLGDEGGK